MATTHPETVSYSGLLRYAFPVILAVSVEPIGGMVDTALLGQIDSNWLASAAAANNILTAAVWLFGFLNFSLTARISQSFGEDDYHAIGSQAQTAFLMALSAGITLFAVLFFGKNFFLTRVMQVPTELMPLASSYYLVRAIGLPFILLSTAMMSVMRGLQAIKISFWMTALITAVNVVLAYALLYVFPIGIVGAAWGTTIAFIVGSLFGILYLQRHPAIKGLWRSHPKRWQYALSFGRDALQIMLRSGTLTLAYFLCNTSASRLGPVYLAAYQIGYQMWLLGAYVLEGFAVTATSMGAKLVGEKQLELWLVMSKRLLHCGLLTGGAFAALFVLGRPLLLRIFTTDIEVIAWCESYWWVLAAIQPANGVLFVLEGILYGIRGFAFMAIAMPLGVFAVFLPALALNHTSLTGIVGALSLLSVFRCVSAYWYFLRRSRSFLPESAILPLKLS